MKATDKMAKQLGIARDKASAAYREAGIACYRAWAAYKEARAAFDKAWAAYEEAMIEIPQPERGGL